MFISRNKFNPSQETDETGQEDKYEAWLPGQQAVVPSVVVIFELEHIQLRVVIFTGLQEEDGDFSRR